MNRIIGSTKFFMLALLALALLPVGVLADQLRTEVVTIQVNITTPRGMTVIGTVVAHRTLGLVTTTDLSFNGMINGSPVTGTATAEEHWLGNGMEDIDITAITSWHGSIAAPQPLSLQLRQDTPGVVSINGVPIAIDGVLEQPGSGRTTYSVADAGQGSKPITQLPNMGADTASAGNDTAGTVAMVAVPSTPGGLQALFLVALLVSGSLVLGGLRLVLHRQGK